MHVLKVIGLIVLGLVGAALVAVPPARSATPIPLAPTATRPAPMTLVPTMTPPVVAPVVKDGAYVELHVTHRPAVWTVVQWQDGSGLWHAVDGWQGMTDGQGVVRWWVSPAQFGEGPFRWAVYEKPGGVLLATSHPFDLPQVSRQRIVVEVPLQP
jgi:hypothetical protein